MSVLSDIFSGSTAGVLQGIGSLAKDIRSAITGDINPEKKAEIETKLLELEFNMNKLQADINLAEAQNPNLFVSGWRPFIGWCCGISLAYTFIGHPLIEWVVAAMGGKFTPPDLHTDYLMELVLAMLGMGSLRTFEKLKGVTK